MKIMSPFAGLAPHVDRAWSERFVVALREREVSGRDIGVAVYLVAALVAR